MNFSHKSVEALLRERSCTKFGALHGKDVWVTKDNLPIRLEPNKMVHLDILEEIAIDQLDMSWWEFDYWIGQNKLN